MGRDGSNGLRLRICMHDRKLNAIHLLLRLRMIVNMRTIPDGIWRFLRLSRCDSLGMFFSCRKRSMKELVLGCVFVYSILQKR